VPAESLATARRFVLGRQGLWPGRRWADASGVDRTLRYIGSVQYDPLDVVGRSHDLALWGRIVNYRAKDLSDALYARRTLFESGGNVQIRPVGELPYLRVAMDRKIAEKRWRSFARSHAPLLARVTRELDRRGPLGPGDFRGPRESRIENYRAGKGAGLALYYLWLRGDVMIAFRRRGEKVFDLTRRLFPKPFPEAAVGEAEDHLILGTLRDLGLATSSQWVAHAQTQIGRSTLRQDWKRRLDRWREEGMIREIEVSGWPGTWWLIGDAARDLESLRSGDVPAAWRPRSTTTSEEVTFLAPLERVTARGRASHLFDFDYLWEVYKPASQRRWGYYTLPVLWGERLPARIELKADRTTGSLAVLGFWPEEPRIRRDAEFGRALARALDRLAEFNGLTSIDPSGLRAPTLERGVKAELSRIWYPERSWHAR
jgi:uncharacterized protein YcaQ